MHSKLAANRRPAIVLDDQGLDQTHGYGAELLPDRRQALYCGELGFSVFKLSGLSGTRGASTETNPIDRATKGRTDGKCVHVAIRDCRLPHLRVDCPLEKK